jgi:hypothetical protein
MHAIVGQPGSLYLTGILHCRIELTYLVRKAFLGTFVLLLMVTKSFRNLAYKGTYWMAFRNGMLICTCLNTSKMSSNFEPFLGAVSLSGNGALGTNFWGLPLAIGTTVSGPRSLSGF